MSDKFDHLNKDALSFVERSNEIRIDYINRTRWIEHPAAARAQSAVLQMFNQPRSTRMQHISLVGISGSGKTSLIKRFIRRNNPGSAQASGVPYHPILVVQMPADPVERDFLENICDALGTSYFGFDYPRYLAKLRINVKYLLQKSKTHTLVIEDFHSIEVGKARERQMFLQMLRVLAMRLRVSFVFTGTLQVRSALRLDEQLHARTRIEVELRPWKSGPDLQAFSKALLRSYPLRQPSIVDELQLGRLLAERSNGRTDLIVDAFRRTAVAAIVSGQEMIDLPALRDCPVWEGVIYTDPPFPIPPAATKMFRDL